MLLTGRENSPKFSPLVSLNSVLKSGHKHLNSLAVDHNEMDHLSSPDNEMDHNLSCRDPNWVIQKLKIKFTDVATTSMKNTSPNSHRFLTKNQSQILDSM